MDFTLVGVDKGLLIDTVGSLMTGKYERLLQVYIHRHGVSTWLER